MPGTRQSRSAASPVTGSPSSGVATRRLAGPVCRRLVPCPLAPTRRADVPQTGRIGDGEPSMPVADPALHASHRLVLRRPSCGRRD
jgi:hypothetical protein